MKDFDEIHAYFQETLKEGKQVSPTLYNLVKHHLVYLKDFHSPASEFVFEIVVSRSPTTWSRYSRYNEWCECGIEGAFVNRVEKMRGMFLKAVRRIRRVKISTLNWEMAFVGYELFPIDRDEVIKRIMFQLEWKDTSITLSRNLREGHSWLTIGFWVRLSRPHGKRGKLSQEELSVLERQASQRTQMDEAVSKFLSSPARLWKIEHYPEEGSGIYQVQLQVSVIDDLWKSSWNDLVGFASMLL